MTPLRPGDRVHYPGDPADRGTVFLDGDTLTVLWDVTQGRGHPPDLEAVGPGLGRIKQTPMERALSLAKAERRLRYWHGRRWEIPHTATAGEGR